jgi:hypothetical protein
VITILCRVAASERILEWREKPGRGSQSGAGGLTCELRRTRLNEVWACGTLESGLSRPVGMAGKLPDADAPSRQFRGASAGCVWIRSTSGARHAIG